MKWPVRSTVVAFSYLVALSACGSSSNDAQPGGGAAAPATTSSTTPADANPISSVTFSRSGGLKPISVNRIFTVDQSPPKGFTASDVHRVLAAARAFVSSGTKLHRFSIGGVCCDRYAYRVTIAWVNGTTKTFSTADGIAQPKQFDALLHAVA